MVIVYGMLRAIAVAFAKMASWQHSRAKKRLDQADAAFVQAENLVKADEVEAGRPANFASQYKLLKQYEGREAANERWKRAATRLAKRQRFAKRLADFQGKKLPYSFGVIDMALAMKIVEFAYQRNLDLNSVSDLIARYF